MELSVISVSWYGRENNDNEQDGQINLFVMSTCN